MSLKEGNICRLCLKIPNTEFEERDELMRQIFDVLLLQLDLSLTKDYIVCRDCMKVAKKCLNFKHICIGTERVVLSFSTGGEKAKHNIQAIYKERDHVEAIIEGDLDICRFCLTRLEKNKFVALDALISEPVFEMLPKYMPEMDFNIIENPIICTTCKENLEGYCKFVLNCLEIEATIKEYCRAELTRNRGVIMLNNMAQFLTKNLYEYPQSSKIKEESTKLENEYSEFMQFEQVYIKEGISLVSDHQIYGSVHKVSEIKMYKCLLCAYESKQKRLLNRHMLVHKDIPETIMYKCSLCTYQTKRKNTLNRHMFVHKDVSELRMYKCSLCAYEGKQKSYLQKHMLLHKNASEQRTYSCSLCAYKGKGNGNLRSHMLVHKDVSEIKMYKCSLCAYESKKNCNLKTHMLVHKDVSEIQMYKCSLCSYEGKQKYSLQKHMLVHKDVSEIKMYKCSLCAYEAKNKSNVKDHMLVHNKNVSGVKMYKCAWCTYEGKQKNELKSHMLIHKDISGIKTYNCLLCAYKAKQKRSLKLHMLIIHNNVSVLSK